jgi:putative hydrolase of the HAD superfamily
MKASSIKSVISDLGKVILFFDNNIFLNRMMAFSPLSLEEMRKAIFSHFEIVQDFDRGKLSSHQFYELASEKLQAEISFEDFYLMYNDIFSINPPVLNLLKKLKSLHRLILLSNTDVMRFGFIKQRFPEILIFDDYVLSFEVGRIKPDPHIYRVALEKAEAKAEECVFIDDREENIEGARQMGINSILFQDHAQLETSLREYGLSFKKI